MTLNDLLLLIKRYLGWVIIVPLVCALLAGGIVAVKDQGKDAMYSATATLTVTDPTNSLSPVNLTLLLNATAQNVVSGGLADGVVVTATPEDKTQSVKLTAVASAKDAAQDAANNAAEETSKRMRATLFEQAEVFKAESAAPDDGLLFEQDAASVKAAALEACVYTISPSMAAVSAGSSGAIKYAAVGLAGGLFVVVLALALYDSVKRPIKVRSDIARVTDLPVLNSTRVATGVELAQAFLFARCEGAPKNVCVVAEGGKADEFVNQLKAALVVKAEDGARIHAIAPLSEDASGYSEAQRADAVLVCVTQWKSTADDLASVLEELKLAEARMVGVVLV